ncbi:MAG: hypothetical protein AB8B49_07595 [Nitratireductor sp.]
MARISVLQLDTHFPRVAGDIGCHETFQCELEIIKVPNASVAKIVTDTPQEIELAPFVEAASKATGDLITTSCGFLAPFQDALVNECKAPFIGSALEQLRSLQKTHTPQELKIFTFDASKLNRAHLPNGCEAFESSIIGLDEHSHLRNVIENDLLELDPKKAKADIDLIANEFGKNTKSVLLECTNLPPYKVEMNKNKSIKIFDILTAIEAIMPNSVNPHYLSPQSEMEKKNER